MAEELQTMPPGTTSGSASRPLRKLGGLLVRKERWGLSWKGWAALGVILIGLALLGLLAAQPFLAVTEPVPPGEYLVVEGWLKVDPLRDAYAAFKQGGYQTLITSGCRVEDEWDPNQRVTYADWAALKLAKLGVPVAHIQAVPCYVQRKDRTYSSALAVKQWMDAHGIHVRQLNVVSEGTHARRSRLLFEKAFGPDVKIGIIAVENKEYDPNHWWRSSEGVREVVGEGIAYLYARFLFFPSNAQPE